MKTFKTLALAVLALGAVATVTPAQAHDDRHWNGHYRGRVIYHGGPRYYGHPYRYGPRYYGYGPAYSYYSGYPAYGPSFTFAFGGHRYYHHRHWR